MEPCRCWCDSYYCKKILPKAGYDPRFQRNIRHKLLTYPQESASFFLTDHLFRGGKPYLNIVLCPLLIKKPCQNLETNLVS